MEKLLGKKVREKITGFEGIASSKHIYLTGCNQYGIQAPVDKNGVIPDIKYFDEGRLEVIGEGFSPEDLSAEKNGCDNREHP